MTALDDLKAARARLVTDWAAADAAAAAARKNELGALDVVIGQLNPAPPPPPPPASSIASKLGFYPGYGNPSWFVNLETWLGRKALFIEQMGDISNVSNYMSSVWGEIVAPGAEQTLAARVTFVSSVPLAFGQFVDANTAAGQATARAQLQATVNGANDAAYRYCATSLVSAGFEDAVIRLGWEFDGGWMPWSSRGNETLWAQAYRRVAGIFRSVSAAFRFDWCGDPGYMQGQAGAYPGDDVVDIVGLDVYDKGQFSTPAWNSVTKSWADPVAAWAKVKAYLQWSLDFAKSHGKQVSYPEWALDGVNGTTATSNVGGDNPTFIQGMYDWMTALPASGAGSLAYHSYFNEDTEDGNHRINASWFPNASARFKTLFSAA